MRILSVEPNKLDLVDRLSGSKLTVFYRMPETSERLGYENESLKREGGRMIQQLGTVRRKYGLAIITGIGEDCFGTLKDGKAVPISSDPESEFFDKNWKTLLEQQASDVVQTLGAWVFEDAVQPLFGSAAMDDSTEEEPGENDDTKPVEEDAAGN